MKLKPSSETLMLAAGFTMTSQIPRFYWYKSGGWTLAVDAVSNQDAREYLRLHHPGREFKYSGHYTCPRQTMACCGITTKRQEQIHENFER
jgi:hypothetical protein